MFYDSEIASRSLLMIRFWNIPIPLLAAKGLILTTSEDYLTKDGGRFLGDRCFLLAYFELSDDRF